MVIMSVDMAPDVTWIGITIHSQEQADQQIGDLIQFPATVRFVHLRLRGPVVLPRRSMADIHWVIVEGERIDCVRLIVNQCQGLGVACYVKSVGGFAFSDLPVDLRVHQFPPFP